MLASMCRWHQRLSSEIRHLKQVPPWQRVAEFLLALTEAHEGEALVALPFSSLALSLMQPSAALDQLARGYFQIRLFGLPAALASYALIGWLLGSQNARGPLAILLTCNLLNVALDLLFVLGLHWGVAGAAWASVLAEWSGALLGLSLARRALRPYAGHIDWSALRRWPSWRALLAVNRDIFIRTLALQAVFFLITVQGTRLGDTTVAANALLLNGLLLSAHALDGLAHAVEALCGHALGAGDRQALRRSLLVAGAWSLLAGLGFALLFGLGGHGFIALQTDIAPVRATALTYLPYLGLLPLIAVWSYLLDGLFIGATRAREMRDAMLIALLPSLALGWLLQPLGNHGLWLANGQFGRGKTSGCNWPARTNRRPCPCRPPTWLRHRSAAIRCSWHKRSKLRDESRRLAAKCTVSTASPCL